jgi:enoyl-CoA hydratase/carnithine racemase
VSVAVEVKGHMLVAQVQRPEKRNAIDKHRASGISAALVAVAAQFEAAEAAGWDATARALDIVAASDDVHEGIDAFFERRTPQWRGR